MAEKKQPAATTPLPNTPKKLTADKRQYDFNKYGVSATTYPLDLFTNTREYGDNYVVFYINVPEKSSLIQEGGSSYGKTTDKDTVEVGSAIAKTTGEIKSGTAGGLANKFATKLGAGVRDTKRLKDSITLNIPNNLTTRYSMNWDVEDLVLGSAALDVANALVGKTSAQSTGIIDKLKSAAAVGANIAMSKLPGGSAFSAATGLAANPKKEQLFKNVDFRTFNVEYQFAARSEEESRNIKQIIKMFKLHMHPEFNDSAGYLFIYPSEFEIVYYKGDSENLELPRHTSCVLVDMSVNYTSQIGRAHV